MGQAQPAHHRLHRFLPPLRRLRRWSQGFAEDWGPFEVDSPEFKDVFKGYLIDLSVFQFLLL